MLSQESVGIDRLESEKSELEARISRVSQDLNLVLSTEKTLAVKVKMFEEKCVNLEAALETAANSSSVEIRALKRELTLAQEKNQSLSTAYDELKAAHEGLISDRATELDKLRKELAAAARAHEKSKADLEG